MEQLSPKVPSVSAASAPGLTSGGSSSEATPVAMDAARAASRASALQDILGSGSFHTIARNQSASSRKTVGQSERRDASDIDWFRRHFRNCRFRARRNVHTPQARNARRKPPLAGTVRDRLQRMPEHRRALIEALLMTVPTEGYLAMEETIYRLVEVGPDWNMVRELADTAIEPGRSRAAGLLVAERISLFL